jgi:hypothetical protein
VQLHHRPVETHQGGADVDAGHAATDSPER